MARPRLHDDCFLEFLREQGCCCGCGRGPRSEAAHVRLGFRALGKKPDDRFCLPLHPECHRSQHEGEAKFWAARGLDPFEIAARLYAEYGGNGGTARKKRERKPRPKRSVKIMSRGFDKTKTRKMNGRIEERKH
jgi:hypothetical protein